MHLTRKKSNQRQSRPLTGSKGFNELFFCVLKRGTDRINGGNRQAYTSDPDVQQGTAKAERGQSDSEQENAEVGTPELNSSTQHSALSRMD